MKRTNNWFKISAAARINSLSFIIWLFLLSTAPAQSTITLNFTTLPSAQGWTYLSDGAPEATIFSISGGVLTQNTLAGPFSFESYNLFGVVNPQLPFTVSIRARVLAESGQFTTNSFGFGFLGCANTEGLFGFGLGTNRIEDALGNVLSTSIDNTQFHDYKLEATPGVGYSFFVDNVLIATGLPRFGDCDGNSNIAFGDLTRGTGAHAEVTSFTFSQLLEVEIDIKPGSDPNSINPNSNGVIPVAILTTATFDATTVEPLSVKFGPGEATESHGKGHIQDADGDGDNDLVLHFKTRQTGIQCGQTSASLTGKTFGGEDITGSDAIQTVGCTAKAAAEAEAGIPEGYALLQNYPNPFNPETEIRFQLLEAGHVVVKIFNTVGEEIRTLVDAPYQTGYHRVRWDGKDKNGNPVTSGVYLCQLRAGSFSQVRKMSLLR